jgi:hypothetical protein
MGGAKMAHQDEERPDRREQGVPVSYEPPRVETVLSPAELEREILYAGVPTSR